MTTEVNEFLGHLDGGTIKEQLSRILSEVAANVVVHEKTGKVKLELEIKQIGSGAQVMIEHKVTFTKPTSKGSMTEDSKSGTPMHVASNGDMSLLPLNQEEMFENKGSGKLAAV